MVRFNLKGNIMSKLRVDQLSPVDDSASVNVMDLYIVSELSVFSKNFTGQNTRQLIRDRESALLPDNNVVRFVTWNNQGTYSINQFYGGDYANRQRVVDLADWYLRMGADFVGGQEHFIVPNLPASDIAVYPYQSGYHSNSMWYSGGRNYGNMVLSTRPLNNTTGIRFASPPDATDTEYRSYIRTEMIVNGATIAIYNTHLALTESRYTAMIAELVTRLQSETATHIVVMADWNTQNDSDFQPFISLGFSMVNRNGEINTNNVGGSWYIDRIFHKGFSAQGDYGTFNTPVSLGDHKPLYVDLTI